MGGSTVGTIAAGGFGFAVGGPAGAAVGIAAAQELRDKKLPGALGLPEIPKIDSAADLLRRRMLVSRIQAAAIPGPGRSATVATGPQGVTTPARTTRATLRGGM